MLFNLKSVLYPTDDQDSTKSENISQDPFSPVSGC